MRKIIAVYVLWGVVLNGLMAQDINERDFTRYTRQQGLSNNFISGIVQDSTGYIWVSTLRGLNRFDGTAFKTMLYTGGAGSLPDNIITSMQLLPGDKLAVATVDGAQIISTKTLASQTLEVPTEAVLRYWSNYVRFIRQDADGNYGMSTHTGFYIFSPGGVLKKRLDGYTVKDVGRSWMQFGKYLNLLPNGNLLQENDNGLYQYNRGSNSIEEAFRSYPALQWVASFLGKPGTRIFFIGGNYLLFTNIAKNSLVLLNLLTGNASMHAACFDINEINWQSTLSRISDSVWALTSGNKGFYLLHIDTLSHNVTCYPQNYFSNYSCHIIFTDRQQRLWIGTGKGLFMQNLQREIIRSAFIAPGKHIDSNVTVTSLLVEGNTIFAGTAGNGLLVLDKQVANGMHRLKAVFAQPRFVHVYSVILVQPDTLWLGTDSGLVWLHTGNYSSGIVNTSGIKELSGAPYEARLFFHDKAGNTWIGSNELNRIFCYRKASHTLQTIGGSTRDMLLKINVPESFAEDGKGNIWIGGDAIARWNPQKNCVDTLIQQLPAPVSRKIGFKVLNDMQGDIWTLLPDDGIVKITGSNALLHLDDKRLSWDYYITKFPTAVYNRVFASSESSIGILDMQTQKSITLGYYDGLPERTISTWGFNYDSLGRGTWFACGNTICQIPDGAFVNKQHSPVFNINELAVNNDSIIPYPSATVALEHSQNNIRISFSAINYTDIQNMRFWYRLLNTHDDGWTPLPSQQVQFNNLKPGVYALQLKVTALNSQWPEQVKEMTIEIRPPFHETPTFIVLAALGVLAVVYLVYRWQINAIRKTEREKAQVQHLKAELAEAQLSALQTQMNPHFIFNALNSIKRMVLDKETAKASRYLGKFAQMIRLTLSHSKETFVTLRENIEYLEAYLDMEQLRFDDSFSYSIQTGPGLGSDELNVPTLMLQPLVENAIWHGLMPRKGEKKIVISFMQRNGRVVCSIEDNGIGIGSAEKLKGLHKTTHRPVGIENLRNRIKILNEKYDAGCTLTITDLQEEDPAVTGTRAVLSFLLINS